MQMSAHATTVKRMEPMEREALKLPTGGHWYTQIKGATDEFKKHNRTGFMVAWDKDASTGSKVFGYYTTPENFFQNVSEFSTGLWHAYEVIPEDCPSKLYLDVEFEGDKDETHSKLQWLISHFAEFFNHEANWDDDVIMFIACSSRMGKQGVYRNSYHIVFPEFIMKNNHDGEMEDLVQAAIYFNKGEAHKFFYTSGEKQKCVIDTKVYTRNRCFRTLGSCKKGSDTPFLRLMPGVASGQTDFFIETERNNQLNFMEMVIASPSTTEDLFYHLPEKSTPSKENQNINCTPVYSQLSEKSFSVPKQPRKVAGTKRKTMESDGTALPFDTRILKDILIHHGDNVSDIGLTKYFPEKRLWNVQGTKTTKVCPRPCLFTPGISHCSNNILLVIREDGHEIYRVKYRCYGKSCQNIPGNEHSCRHNVIDLATVKRDISGKGWVFDFPKDFDTMSEISFDDDDDARSCVSEMTVTTSQMPSQTQRYSGQNPWTTPLTMYNKRDGAGYLIVKENLYPDIKAQFEIHNFKIAHPYCFLTICPATGEYQRLSPDKFQSFHCAIKCFSSEDDNPCKPKHFIHEWLHDETHRTFTNLTIDPSNRCPSAFSLWRGYLCDNLPLLPSMSPDDAMEPIIQHISDVITDGNQEHTEWVLDWLAHIVQRPEKKTEVCIVLYGSQGCGKGIIFEFLRRRVLGPKHTYQTPNPKVNLFGQFANGLLGKVLIQVDEAKEMYKDADMLKNCLTNDTINVEPKGKDSETHLNIANLVITTNNPDACKVESSDRRMCLFECSDVHRMEIPYIQSLVKHFYHTPGVPEGVFHYLKNRRLPADINFQCTIPDTRYRAQAQEQSITDTNMFLSAILNSKFRTDPLTMQTNSLKRFGATELWEMYRKWCDTNSVSLCKQSVWAQNMMRVGSAVKKLKSNNQYYEINLDRLEDYLISNKQYSESATLPRESLMAVNDFHPPGPTTPN